MRSIALFGGSFDPPHLGHVLAATWVLSTSGVDELWVMPAFDHAFDKELSAFEHRKRMGNLCRCRRWLIGKERFYITKRCSAPMP